MKTLALIIVALLVPVAAFARQSDLSPGYYECESMEGNTSYFSDIFLGPGDADAVGKGFSQMVAAKYGYSGRISCPIAFKTPEGLKRLQDQHQSYAEQRAQQGRKIVETHWTYNGAPSLSIQPKPTQPSGSAGATSGSASGSGGAKTTETKSPRSDAAPAKPATPPPAAPAPAAAPAFYSYCYAYGTPSTGGGAAARQHFYVSQIFPLAQSDRPNQAFEHFLGPAHPGEAINASCLAPGSLEIAQKNRQTVLNARRKDPSFDVVELDWKR